MTIQIDKQSTLRMSLAGETEDNYFSLDVALSRPGDVGDMVGTQRRLPFTTFLVQGEESPGPGDGIPSLIKLAVLSDRSCHL